MPVFYQYKLVPVYIRRQIVPWKYPTALFRISRFGFPSSFFRMFGLCSLWLAAVQHNYEFLVYFGCLSASFIFCQDGMNTVLCVCGSKFRRRDGASLCSLVRRVSGLMSWRHLVVVCEFPFLIIKTLNLSIFSKKNR